MIGRFGSSFSDPTPSPTTDRPSAAPSSPPPATAASTSAGQDHPQTHSPCTVAVVGATRASESRRELLGRSRSAGVCRSESEVSILGQPSASDRGRSGSSAGALEAVLTPDSTVPLELSSVRRFIVGRSGSPAGALRACIALARSRVTRSIIRPPLHRRPVRIARRSARIALTPKPPASQSAACPLELVTVASVFDCLSAGAFFAGAAGLYAPYPNQPSS